MSELSHTLEAKDEPKDETKEGVVDELKIWLNDSQKYESFRSYSEQYYKGSMPPPIYLGKITNLFGRVGCRKFMPRLIAKIPDLEKRHSLQQAFDSIYGKVDSESQKVIESTTPEPEKPPETKPPETTKPRQRILDFIDWNSELIFRLENSVSKEDFHKLKWLSFLSKAYQVTLFIYLNFFFFIAILNNLASFF